MSPPVTRRRAGKSVRRFATRSDGKVIEPLGLGNFEAAKGADEIARKIALGILLQHEMTVVGVFYACHRLTIPPLSFHSTRRTLNSSMISPSWARSRNLRLPACRERSQAAEALCQKHCAPGPRQAGARVHRGPACERPRAVRIQVHGPSERFPAPQRADFHGHAAADAATVSMDINDAALSHELSTAIEDTP